MMPPALSKPYYLRYLYVLLVLLSRTVRAAWTSDELLQKRQSPNTSPLVDFQVTEPVYTPSGPRDQYGCIWTEVLMEYEFANSYYKPFVGRYSSTSLPPHSLTVISGEHVPPPCSFNRVTMNFTVTSKGRQFDRLGLMYLGDVEVFRTSTAEPTANGIVWTYTKEMGQYNTLWKEKQKIIFDLPNVVDNTYTGPYLTSLVATFFTVLDSQPTADSILAISAKQSGVNKASAFSLPSQNATVSYQFPLNVERAVVSLSACGQIAEEFWYTNVFSSDVNTFESTAGTLYGFGPFREVQLLIDGQLAGVSWPFPVIFTGGIVPGFWRPIVGIDAFDLRQHEIDVTPWLPVLCDGASHAFEIRVVGLNDDGKSHATISDSVGSFWVVTGTIFLFLGRNGSVTTGTQPSIDAPAPEVFITSLITTNSSGANQDLTYTTSVSRRISITSNIETSAGSRLASWSQTLSYKSFNKLSDQGYVQFTEQNTTGSDLSTNGYANTYSYPLTVNSSFFVDSAGEVGINATLSRGLDYNVYGPAVFPSGIQTFNRTSPANIAPAGLSSGQNGKSSPGLPLFSGSLLATTQTGSAGFFSGLTLSYSFGNTEQDFDFKGAELGSPSSPYELYHRHVVAVNGTVTEDEQTLPPQFSSDGTSRLLLSGTGGGISMVDSIPNNVSVRALLGRGPGQPKSVPL